MVAMGGVDLSSIRGRVARDAEDAHATRTHRNDLEALRRTGTARRGRCRGNASGGVIGTGCVARNGHRLRCTTRCTNFGPHTSQRGTFWQSCHRSSAKQKAHGTRTTHGNHGLFGDGRYRTRRLQKTSLTSSWDSFQDSRTRTYPNLSTTLLFLFPPTVFHPFSSFLKNKPAEAVSIPYWL